GRAGGRPPVRRVRGGGRGNAVSASPAFSAASAAAHDRSVPLAAYLRSTTTRRASALALSFVRPLVTVSVSAYAPRLQLRADLPLRPYHAALRRGLLPILDLQRRTTVEQLPQPPQQRLLPPRRDQQLYV